MSAVNSIGEGTTSLPSSCALTSAMSEPSVPKSLSVDFENGKSILRWEEPVDLGGVTKVSFEVNNNLMIKNPFFKFFMV